MRSRNGVFEEQLGRGVYILHSTLAFFGPSCLRLFRLLPRKTNEEDGAKKKGLVLESIFLFPPSFVSIVTLGFCRTGEEGSTFDGTFAEVATIHRPRYSPDVIVNAVAGGHVPAGQGQRQRQRHHDDEGVHQQDVLGDSLRYIRSAYEG